MKGKATRHQSIIHAQGPAEQEQIPEESLESSVDTPLSFLQLPVDGSGGLACSLQGKNISHWQEGGDFVEYRPMRISFGEDFKELRRLSFRLCSPKVWWQGLSLHTIGDIEMALQACLAWVSYGHHDGVVIVDTNANDAS